MGGVHVIIGIVEAIITVSVLRFLLAVKPDILNGSGNVVTAVKPAFHRVLLIVFLAALALSGYVSYYASSHPDGLEWVLEKLGFNEFNETDGTDEPAGEEAFPFAGMPDYEMPGTALQEFSPRLSRGLAGVAGSLITIVVLVAVGGAIRRFRRQKI